MKHLFILLLTLRASFSFAQEVLSGAVPEDQIIYYCTPCNCENDGKYFNSSGRCQACQMPLQPTVLGLKRTPTSSTRPKVGIFIFNHADIMDVTGPLSVFEHAGFNIATFSMTADPVRIGMNMEIQPDFTMETLPIMDVLVFPGGGMAESNPGDPAIVQFIRQRSSETKVLFSVCSGAFFLGESGALDDLQSTTFAGLIPQLKENYPESIVLDDVKYVDNGQVITSAGLSSGIDAAFQVVSKFYGIGRTQDLANHMEYPWDRSNDYARSQLSDGLADEVRSLVSIFSTEYFYSQGDKNSWEYRYKLTTQMSIQSIMSLIQTELQKSSTWETINKNRVSIQGLVDHPILGRGKVKITLHNNIDGETMAIIQTSRVKIYNP